MKKTLLTSIAALALSGVSGVALAGSYEPPVVPAPVIAPPPAAPDWSGAYIDLYYGWANDSGTPVNVLGTHLGYNLQNGRTIYGGEIDLGRVRGSPITYWTASVRGGRAVSDKLMVFGKLGYGQSSVGTRFANFGLGAEYKLTQSLYTRLEYIHWQQIGGAFTLDGINLGVGIQF